MQEQQLLQPERIPECDLIILLRDYISAKHLSVTCLQSLILRLFIDCVSFRNGQIYGQGHLICVGKFYGKFPFRLFEGRFGDMQEYKRIDVNELIVNSVLLSNSTSSYTCGEKWVLPSIWSFSPVCFLRKPVCWQTRYCPWLCGICYANGRHTDLYKQFHVCL